MLKVKQFVCLVFTCCLVSCVTPPSGPVETPATIAESQKFLAYKNSVNFYFARPWGNWNQHSRFELLMNDELIAKVNHGQFVNDQIDPGRYKFTVNQIIPDHREHNGQFAEFELDIEAGAVVLLACGDHTSLTWATGDRYLLEQNQCTDSELTTEYGVTACTRSWNRKTARATDDFYFCRLTQNKFNFDDAELGVSQVKANRRITGGSAMQIAEKKVDPGAAQVVATQQGGIKKQQSAFAPVVNKPLKNPAVKSSSHLSTKNFVNPYQGTNRRYFQVSKSDYKTAIKHADSGYAYDAFMASTAYWTGHYKGKITSFGKGRNKQKSLKYLFLASDLGWPEASYLLYKCYKNGVFVRESFKDWMQINEKPLLAGGLNLSRYQYYGSCIHSNTNWKEYGYKPGQHDDFVLSKSNSKARKYLERAVQQGELFDANFSLATKLLPELDKLSSRLDMIVAQLRYQSLLYVANQHANKTNQKRINVGFSERDFLMYQEGFNSCPDIYRSLLTKSAFDEKMACNTTKKDLRFCPGQGYQYLREALEACMLLSPNQQAWDYYFNERLKYYHPYLDGKKYRGNHVLLSAAWERYRQQNNQQKMKWVRGLMTQADANANALEGTWEYESNKLHLKNTAYRQAKEKRQAQQKRQEEVYAKKFIAEQEAMEAEDRRHLNSWKIGQGDNFSTTLQQAQNQTMREINADRLRMKKSRTTSGVAPTYASKSKTTQKPTPLRPTIAGQDSQASSKEKKLTHLKKDNKPPTRTVPIFVQKEGSHGWSTQEAACSYAKQEAIRLAEKRCKLEHKGTKATTNDVPIPVDANCQSYRQMEKDGFTHAKGEWKVTGNIIMHCRLPKPLKEQKNQ